MENFNSYIQEIFILKHSLYVMNQCSQTNYPSAKSAAIITQPSRYCTFMVLKQTIFTKHTWMFSVCFSTLGFRMILYGVDRACDLS